MAVNPVSAARWVGTQLGEAHRGLLPYSGRLLAFGNRGQAEVEAFRDRLRTYRYGPIEFGTADDSWVMFITPPYGFRDTRRLLTALWEATPDPSERKAVQQHIADLHVRLLFARQGFQLDRSWFTCKQVREMGVYIPSVMEAAGPVEEPGARHLLLMSLRPSLN